MEKNNNIENKRRKPLNIILAILVSLILSIVVGLIIYKFTSGYFEKMAMVKHSSGAKRNVEIMLPDGSKVWLNSNSEIRYPKQFGPTQREVFFEGEAFFAVVKNEEKPFIIHSLNTRIEVIGTTFNLRVLEDEPELLVSIVSGELILFDKESDKNAIQLEKGEQGVFAHKTRKISRLVNQDINYLSWQTGKFFFKNSSLGEVTQKLISYYHIQIVFENEALKSCRLSIDIDNQTLNDVMKSIQKVLPVDVETVKRKVIIKGKGC